ncbi:MAG TPA: TonB-dependent receptor [Thermoanaerobaculia bacterium]|nr:TonB-dependent receptor [Thermoanaerobaculia bacterium]
MTLRNTIALIWLLVALPLLAQVTSSITGTATMDGNPLPGVTVTVSSPNLQGTRTSVTDVNGNYYFSALPPGDYTVRFEMESMQTQTRTTRVGLGQTARADAEMRLTAVAEAITVTASAPAVLETTEIQSNYTQELVDDLPIPRHFQAQAALAPNVTTNSPSGAQLVISGAPAHENLYMVNGAVINENLRGQIHSLFIEDAIQETTVLTGAISAEYGRFSGGVVNAITKSGGNDFSGSLRDSLTNPSWSAKSYEDQPDYTDVLNEVYEATLGGRIIRDRLWFFAAGRSTETSTDVFLHDTSHLFQFVQEETRLEGKLTAQITPRHNLMGSYLDLQRPEGPYCFIACYEISVLDPQRELPNSFATLHYSGIFTNSLLAEVGYSEKRFTFKNAGGDNHDFANGTWGYDFNEGAFFGAAPFCGTCGPEERNNEYLDVKLSYYAASRSLGSHNIALGYQDWAEQRISNNYQSGSNFGVYVFNDQTPVANVNDPFRPHIVPGEAAIFWFPILELSDGSNFQTRSLYINDKWDLSSRWQFNLGLRYDKNDGLDASGAKTADDALISPRFGGIFDVWGDNRLRISGSYGRYVAKIAETIGSGATGAGNPAYILYLYNGPEISGLPTPEAFQIMYDWFQSVGGTNATDYVILSGFPGVNSRIAGGLSSPYVDEWTVGVGGAVGRGYVRADVIHRDWDDFYVTRVDRTTGTVRDPLNNLSDVSEIFTSNVGLDRTYEGVSLQASYPFSSRFQLGGNYTWSETKGNVTSETSGSGPVTESLLYYPEYRAFAQNNPSGFLASDQTHKARLWATFTMPTAFGTFTFSGLQRFDSGTPYSAVLGLDPTTYESFMDPAVVEAYQGAPSAVNYYLSDRGGYRWPDIHATDVSINYRLRLGRVELYVQPEIVNIFNNNAHWTGTTSVYTTDVAFNPFAETPVEGVHYEFDENFGEPRNATDYQTARTYRASVGIRF